MTQPNLDTSAFLAFANSVNSTSDMYRLFDQLEELKRLLFKDKEGTIAQKAGFYMPNNLAPIFADIETRGIEPKGDLGQQRFLDAIADFLKSLPVVSVTLAFEPTASFIGKLNSEISAIIGEKAVLNLTVNQYISGGAVFEYKGKRREYILAEKLEDTIADLAGQMAKEERAGSSAS